MIYELEDTGKVKHLFDGWNETLFSGIFISDLTTEGERSKICR